MERLLHQYARGELGRPFLWGETNCVALAVRWLDLAHGCALMAEHRRRMLSAQRAAAWTAKHGLDGLVEVLSQSRISKHPSALAQPGDVLLGWTEDGQIGAHILLWDGLSLSSTVHRGVIQCRTDHKFDVAMRPGEATCPQ